MAVSPERDIGDPRQQALAVTLAVCRRALGGQGAVRVHGGGFAGTALAFVPDDRREMFRRTVEQTLGTDKCRLCLSGILLPTAADTVKIGSRKKRTGTIT